MEYNRKLLPLARRLRRDMTDEERILWYTYLSKYPVKFYRQRMIGNYIVDFYCARAKLIIELDGSQHYEENGLQNDAVRTNKLEERGLLIIRIPNNEITRNLRGVCDYIDSVVESRL